MVRVNCTCISHMLFLFFVCVCFSLPPPLFLVFVLPAPHALIFTRLLQHPLFYLASITTFTFPPTEPPPHAIPPQL
jgi:hypothetical protein